jgi:hypothetical protein
MRRLLLLLYPPRAVPTILLYGNFDNRPWEDKIRSHAKAYLDRALSRFGRPWGSAKPQVGPLATAFRWWADMWVLMLTFGDLLLG